MTERTLYRVVLMALLSLAPVTGAAAQNRAADSGPRLLLIGIDGLRPDYVLEADRHGLRIPNLRRFVREGAYATGARGVVPTVTYPSFTTVLTGVAPAVHGIVANTTFDPLAKNSGGWYWYASDVKVPTLWDAARVAGISTGSVHWPVSVGANVTYNLPQIWRTGTADDRKLLRALATPGLQTVLEKRTSLAYADGIDETIEGDENRGRFAAGLIALHQPGFVTAYFTALDHEQHETGPFTPRVFAVLERIDSIVGRMVSAANAASGGKAIVAIISDHGFEKTEHEVSLTTALRRAGLITFEEGVEKPSAWKAAVWTSGSSGAIILEDAADLDTHRSVRLLLDSLARDPANGIARVLAEGESARRGGYPGAAFVIDLKPGYQFGSRTTGPLVMKKAVGGMHGYMPDNPNMNASFLVAGTGIARGLALGLIDLRDVAPTLADLLGVALPVAEGRKLPVRQRLLLAR